MRKYDISILTAGVLWGIIGLFTRNLGVFGITSGGIVLVRAGGCAVLFFLFALIRDPKMLKIRGKDLWLFLCFGLGTTLFFTYCYYRSIELGSLSAACTLMYSAPVFVMVISLFVFREKFTRRKLLALICAVVGCCFVSGILEGDSALSLGGTVFGLLAGIGYAFYSVCIKALSNRGYESLTINAYGWLFCFLGGLCIWGIAPVAPMFHSGASFGLCLGLMVVCGFFPSLLYSWGLKGEEAGKGAVMASVEPVVASLTGIIVFHESISALGILGVLLVLGAVVILNTGKTE